ncbi:MAG: phage shock protein PspA [Deltaproteobacteria bacterium]|nr:phage shock protein PspA [Deltaproteobacteria bacterium]
MGVFSRVRDIVSSNINAMLDRAEDPEKLVRLMIQEMEDTLVEIKASCAGAMAAKKQTQRALEDHRERTRSWEQRAELAVGKGREDLAREALLEKRRYLQRAETLEDEMGQTQAIIAQYQEQIAQLEEKLATAREKQRLLVQRHVHARDRKRAQEDIRRFETSDVFLRFEQFENRIERMEAEAEMVNLGRTPSLDDEFARLAEGEEIERELETLKAKCGRRGEEHRPM